MKVVYLMILLEIILEKEEEKNLEKDGFNKFKNNSKDNKVKKLKLFLKSENSAFKQVDSSSSTSTHTPRSEEREICKCCERQAIPDEGSTPTKLPRTRIKSNLKMCHFYQQGNCGKGINCTFAHGYNQFGELARPCRFGSGCKNDSCSFFHEDRK